MENQRGIHRRGFLTRAGLAGGWAATAGWRGILVPRIRAATPLPEGTNLLVILTDQERATQQFPAGWEADNLKGLTELKKTGVSFERGFCSSCMCSPSRSTFFTGLFPAQHRVVDTLTDFGEGTASETEVVLDPRLPNLATVMRSIGYETVYKGKWHMNKPAGEEWAASDVAAYGFDQWDPPDAGEDTKIEHYGGGKANADQRYADDALAYLRDYVKRGSPKPFCLVVSLVNPHDVLGYPNDYIAGGYDDSWLAGNITVPASATENLTQAGKPAAQQQALVKAAAGLGILGTPQQRRNYLNFYGNLMKEADRHVQSLLQFLTESGLREKTLIVRTADHGEMGLSHGGMRQKAFVVYEEATRVPLVYSHPKLLSQGRVTSALASHVDFLPTVASLFRVPEPERYGFRGVDYSAHLLKADAPAPQDHVVFTYDDLRAGQQNVVANPPNRIHAIREGRWKFNRYYDAAGVEPDQYEMYDLEADPNELSNLAFTGNPNYARFESERKRLAEKLAEVEKTRLTPPPPAVAEPVQMEVEGGGQEGVQVRWNGKSGQRYQLQSSRDMKAWSNEGEVAVGAGRGVQRTLPVSGSSRYFRVETLPPAP